MFTDKRMKREAQTIQAMIQIYCRKKHASQAGLCPECQELQDYALKRLERCPFQGGKTTCAKCPVHCYKPEMRARVRQVMRFSGPRMLLYHPVMTAQHYLDGLRNEPLRAPKLQKETDQEAS